MINRRHFGSVRKRSSGHWQVLYRHDGKQYSGGSFVTKADALACLSTIEVDFRRGTWIDPMAGDVSLDRYATGWLKQRSDLAVRTRELYEYLLERYIFPDLGQLSIAKVAPTRVRTWNADLALVHPSTAAKAYRLLSTIMKTAVTDGLILSSPCRVKGASLERAAERPLATVAEVNGLVSAMPDRFRLIVLLATWCQLRRGEILGLCRSDVNEGDGVIQIVRSRTFTRDGTSVIKEPKTAAGRRELVVPSNVAAELRRHLRQYVNSGPDSWLFTTTSGNPLTATSLQREWSKARLSIGRPDLHFHDLRHTGLTFAAASGATTAELMHRAGHASMDAAIRYQHATKDRDRLLAEALAKIAEDGMTGADVGD